MVITELKMIEDEKRVATAASQAKQCAWMNWGELRPGNWHGLSWWLWNPSPCPSFYAPSTTSSPALLTTSSGTSQEMTPARCASLQEGPCGMFFHPVGVHSRCTHGAITDWAEILCRVANKPPTQDPHPCISFLQEGEAHLDKSANHKGKSSSQTQGTGRWILT